MTDEHLESLSSNAAHLECLQISYCQKVRGASLKALLGRCKKLKSLLMDHVCKVRLTFKNLSLIVDFFSTVLDSKTVMQVRWEDCNIEELNITASELSQECLVSVLSRLPNLRYLSAGFLESFSDKVVEFLVQMRQPLSYYFHFRHWSNGWSLALARISGVST